VRIADKIRSDMVKRIARRLEEEGKYVRIIMSCGIQADFSGELGIKKEHGCSSSFESLLCSVVLKMMNDSKLS